MTTLVQPGAASGALRQPPGSPRSCAAERRQPPVVGRGRLSLLYGTQTGSCPPTFAIYTNRRRVPEDYRRFLERCMREQLALKGSPVRLRFMRRDSHQGR